ncbi:MAG: hypothetical protein ACRDNB_05815, partial [Gaiellaceae bacterium]
AAVGPSLRANRRRAVAAAVPLALGCAVAVALIPVSWARGQLVVSSQPAFNGMPLARASELEAARVRHGVRPREPVFFVTERAGFLYLVTGARNPTGYDWPAASNIGSQEIASVAADVRTGAITNACFGGRHAFPTEPSLRPFSLERALARGLRPVADAGPCILHRAG